MNITRHAKIRYCERIAQVPEAELKQYLVQNDERICNEIAKLFEHAVLLWKGQLFDNTTKHYYIRDDIVLVTDTNDTSIVTVFRVDFGFPPDVNRQTLKALLAEKRKVEERAEKVAAKLQKRTEPIQNELAGVEEQIASLRAQLELLEQRKAALTSELNTSNYEVQMLRHEAERIAKMICNAVEFKKDLLEWKTTKAV